MVTNCDVTSKMSFCMVQKLHPNNNNIIKKTTNRKNSAAVVVNFKKLKEKGE